MEDLGAQLPPHKIILLNVLNLAKETQSIAHMSPKMKL